MLLLIYNNQLVLAGAREGLLLWYSNILPLLLPFMLISGYIVDCFNREAGFTKKTDAAKTAAAAIFLGVFCGYPIGAKCTADFINNNQLKKEYGTIILPLCNNLSPMFLSGYVCNVVLQNKISFIALLYLIYTPYIMYMLISFAIFNRFFSKKNTSICEACTEDKSYEKITDKNRILSSINQITIIGVYIMICSIIIKLVISSAFIPCGYKPLIASATEVSSGINYVAASALLPQTKKTALIISATSFGGLSSILQTNCVIKSSGLSIFKYTLAKLICSIATYGLTLLFI